MPLPENVMSRISIGRPLWRATRRSRLSQAQFANRERADSRAAQFQQKHCLGWRRKNNVVLLQWLTTADIQKAMPLRAPTPAIANSHGCRVSTVTEATLIAI